MQSSKKPICYSLAALLVVTCVKWVESSSMINGCMVQMCRSDDPMTRFVEFPFRIRSQNGSLPVPRYCGYPGFDLLCDGSNRLMVDLSKSGVFSVQAIDYAKQELWLNDPNNCLAKKLLSLNLSMSSNYSPFVPMDTQDYWLYNCSNDYLKSFTSSIKKVECLSGSNYGVIARTQEILNNKSLHVGCEKLGSIRVPIEPSSQEMEYSDLSSDIKLTWVEPKCSDCFKKGGQCGFNSNSSLDVGCFNLPGSGLARNAILAIALAFAAPVAFFAFCIAYFMLRANCYHRRRRRRDPLGIGITLAVAPIVEPMPQAHPIPEGLDRSTIESYPKVVLGESRRLPKPEDISCPICLGEYFPKETLRTLPHCAHSFHADCIDEWLTMHASCPVCRKSPSRVNGNTDHQ